MNKGKKSKTAFPNGAKAYVAVERNFAEWDAEPFSHTAIELARERVKRGGMNLVSETPETGWTFSINGGPPVPCREHTEGCRPAWIWWAE